MQRNFQVGIDGSGVTGLAVLLTLVLWTNVDSILVVDRRPGPAQVNSSPENNSGTLHQGRAESNYTEAQAVEVDGDAQLVVGFIERFAPDVGKPMATHMIAVGAKEVAAFRERFAMLSPHFADLQLLERDQIAKMAPKVIEGRDPGVPIISLYSEAGYAVDFQKLGEAMLRKALEAAREMGKTVEVRFNTEITRVERTAEGFALHAKDERFHVRTLEVAAGNGSLLVAHQLGFGREFAMLPVAGSYFVTKALLDAKLYAFQDPEIPFAAAHVDPEVNDRTVMRFGPTARPMPFLERGSWKTLWEFLKIGTLTPRGLWGVAQVLFNLHLLTFGLKNVLYELPFVGVYFFTWFAARKLIPSIRASDLRIAVGAGGIRGQLVNLNTGKLMKGERIPAPEGMPCNCIPAPSPGASKCIGGAIKSVRSHVRWLGEGFWFNEQKMRADLTRANYGLPVQSAVS